MSIKTATGAFWVGPAEDKQYAKLPVNGSFVFMTERASPPANYDIVRLTTGSEEETEILNLRDEFFRSVLLDLGFQEGVLERIGAVVVQRELGREEPDKFYPTDDRLHYLVLENETLAIVFDRRNDGNYHEVTRWSRHPSELAMDGIVRMLEASP